jgi:SAM-dependent methyltransferase
LLTKLLQFTHAAGTVERVDATRDAVSPDLRREYQDVARFDTWAAGYESSALQEAFYTRLHRHVLRFAAGLEPAPARMLDVGCGTGRLLRTAAAEFPGTRLVGADISAGMLEQARAMAGPGECEAFVRADSASLPFADAAFDLVTCTACSHHWPDPASVLSELCRITAAGGLLVLAHLQGVAPWDRRGRGVRRCRVRVPSSLAGPLKENRFKITDAVRRVECPVMPATVVVSARRR